MALFLKFKHPSSRPFRWHLDDAVPGVELAEDLDYVSADGHELEYIKKRFPALPVPLIIRGRGGMDPENHREKIRANFPEHLGQHPLIVTWFGDNAKFIVANL